MSAHWRSSLGSPTWWKVGMPCKKQVSAAFWWSWRDRCALALYRLDGDCRSCQLAGAMNKRWILGPQSSWSWGSPRNEGLIAVLSQSWWSLAVARSRTSIVDSSKEPIVFLSSQTAMSFLQLRSSRTPPRKCSMAKRSSIRCGFWSRPSRQPKDYWRKPSAGLLGLVCVWGWGQCQVWWFLLACLHLQP